MMHFLIELRRRLIQFLLGFLIVFIPLAYFANDLYSQLARPLLKHLPKNQELIATSIISPFYIPYELTLAVTLFLTIPLLFYHLWAFIRPALYPHEKRFVWTLLLLTSCLFYAGVSFAYFVVFPLLFGFLNHALPDGVRMTPDISEYFYFTIKMFFIFGMIFEIPLITILLIRMKVVTKAQLVKLRPYIIVAAFIIGMLLTPPDVLSQIMLALPIWFLFELGLLFPHPSQGLEHGRS
jgi:sec-independent protein translocase protein TatC